MELDFLKYAASLVDYNPETGVIVWKEKSGNDRDAVRWNARYSGKEAGTIDDKGYRRILIKSFDGKARRIRSHQLAFFIATGSPQMFEIDHINQNKLDNRACNLRDVPKSGNQRNRPMVANNKSGFTGVTWNRLRGKWQAGASIDGKNNYLGLYSDIKDAANAVVEFRSANGFTEIHGLPEKDLAAAEIGKEMGK